MSNSDLAAKVDDATPLPKLAKPTASKPSSSSAAASSTPQPLNLVSKDPFAEDFDDDTPAEQIKNDAPGGNKIHIRIQQRNGRKTLTTLQGLPKQFDPKKILKAFKKEFACNGTVVEDAESGQVIQLQGDQRAAIRKFLVDAELLTEKEAKERVQVHGH